MICNNFQSELVDRVSSFKKVIIQEHEEDQITEGEIFIGNDPTNPEVMRCILFMFLTINHYCPVIDEVLFGITNQHKELTGMKDAADIMFTGLCLLHFERQATKFYYLFPY